MTSQLIEMLSKTNKVELYRVVGIAIHNTAGVHVDEGRLYAAVSEEDAVVQANKFWTEDMGYGSFNGHAKVIRRVGEYRIVLVKDDE